MGYDVGSVTTYDTRMPLYLGCLFCFFITLPLAVLGILIGVQQIDTLPCTQPLAAFLLTGGGVITLGILCTLLKAYAAVKVKSSIRIRNTLAGGVYDESLRDVGSSHASWLGCWSGLIAVAKVLTVLVYLFAVVWAVFGSLWVFSNDRVCETEDEKFAYAVSLALVIYYYVIICFWCCLRACIASGSRGWFEDYNLGDLQTAVEVLIVEDSLQPLPSSVSASRQRGGGGGDDDGGDESGSGHVGTESQYSPRGGAPDYGGADGADFPEWGHTMVKVANSRAIKASCNSCKKGISDSNFYRCLRCSYSVHERCRNSEPNFACKDPWRDPAREHKWIRGNAPGVVPMNCGVCGLSTSSSKLEHWRCVWCHATAHDDHLAAMPECCTYGMHRDLIIPPGNAVVSEDDPTKYYFRSNYRPSATPLLVFINRKSGAQQGTQLVEYFSTLLNPLQVFDLNEGGPEPGLQAFRRVPNFRILAAGGDGTIGWVLSVLDRLDLDYNPPVAVLPLGTGNDLARSLGWGPGYEGEDIVEILERVGDARVVEMDRWRVDIATLGGASASGSGAGSAAGSAGESGANQPDADGLVWERKTVLNNYFSIGSDASVTLAFHEDREAHPEKYKSRNMNKVRYGLLGAKNMSAPALADLLEVSVDGVAIDLGSAVTLSVVNLPNYASGSNMWGKSVSEPWHDMRVDDGVLEVTGISSSFHMGRVVAKMGLPTKLAQGSEIVIRYTDNEPLACQIDGEPWNQPPSVFRITHFNRARMLYSSDFDVCGDGLSVSEGAPTTASSATAVTDNTDRDPDSTSSSDHPWSTS